MFKPSECQAFFRISLCFQEVNYLEHFSLLFHWDFSLSNFEAKRFYFFKSIRLTFRKRWFEYIYSCSIRHVYDTVALVLKEVKSKPMILLVGRVGIEPTTY